MRDLHVDAADAFDETAPRLEIVLDPAGRSGAVSMDPADDDFTALRAAIG